MHSTSQLPSRQIQKYGYWGTICPLQWLLWTEAAEIWANTVLPNKGLYASLWSHPGWCSLWLLASGEQKKMHKDIEAKEWGKHHGGTLVWYLLRARREGIWHFCWWKTRACHLVCWHNILRRWCLSGSVLWFLSEVVQIRCRLDKLHWVSALLYVVRTQLDQKWVCSLFGFLSTSHRGLCRVCCCGRWCSEWHHFAHNLWICL